MKNHESGMKILLIVDDNDEFRESLVENPIITEKYKTISAASCEEAKVLIDSSVAIDAVLLDYDFRPSGSLGKMNGLDFLKYLNSKRQDLPIIMMSGIKEGRGQIAIESIKNYAEAFLDKPFKMAYLVSLLDEIFLRHNIISQEYQKTMMKFNQLGFLTQNPKLAELMHDAVIVAEKSVFNILIFGETGTGKTKFAKILHQLTPQSHKDLIELHCAQISQDINSFKSHLFGHKKGSFTGAFENKKGILETDGIIIFDDVQHIPVEVQKGLLQVFQSRFFFRMGEENKPIPFKARIFSTSTLNKSELFKAGMLEEFFYRINGESITIPPLRERIEDIPLLVDFFARQMSRDLKSFDKTVINYMQTLDWYGNVRQLEDFVKRLIIHSKDDIINLSLLKKEIRKEFGQSDSISDILQDISLITDLEDTLNKIRKEVITRCLAFHKGNISETAKALGYKNHNSIKYWAEKIGFNLNEFKF